MAEARGRIYDLDSLEASLAAIDPAADPDGWAVAAYRLGLARSELVTNREELADVAALLEKVGRVLTPDRAPLEHSRILTAVGNCQRVSGRPDLAAASFERAVELLAGRSDPVEHGAALVNLGLARTEADQGQTALDALGQAIDVLDRSRDRSGGTDEEHRRTLGAAQLNRAQAFQALGGDGHLIAAVDGYRAAIDVLNPESPQSGMAYHGLATALLEQARRRDEPEAVAQAIASSITAINQALSVFTYEGFPFQHAIARHSLAVAHQFRASLHAGGELSPDDALGDGGERNRDLALAIHHSELALGVFDPRLHSGQWRTVKATLDEITAAVAPRTAAEAVMALLADVEEHQRTALLRDRLVRFANWPDAAVTAGLQRFTTAMAALEPERYRAVAQSLISVLMELPDHVLAVAARCVVEANREAADENAANRALDDAIQARLFGPQRVRVRDLLEAEGWKRP